MRWLKRVFLATNVLTKGIFSRHRNSASMSSLLHISTMSLFCLVTLPTKFPVCLSFPFFLSILKLAPLPHYKTCSKNKKNILNQETFLKILKLYRKLQPLSITFGNFSVDIVLCWPNKCSFPLLDILNAHSHSKCSEK